MRSKLAWLLIAAFTVAAETRPRYGGVLRIELRDAIEEADPPSTGPTLAQLSPAFTITRWETHHAVYTSDESAPGGRPVLDTVDIQMGRPGRDADIVELSPTELRRLPAGQRLWTSSPVHIVALVFASRVEDVRVREALARAVDRAAIHKVLLHGQGEASAALLPQWISGYAFLFPSATDIPRARAVLAGAPPAVRNLTLASDVRPVADRIALNARDVGLNVTVVPGSAPADVRLVEARITTSSAPQALAILAATFGLPEPPRAETPEALYAAERALLSGCRVVPLFHLPDIYSVSPRVKGGPGITPLGEWRFESLWIDRP